MFELSKSKDLDVQSKLRRDGFSLTKSRPSFYKHANWPLKATNPVVDFFFCETIQTRSTKREKKIYLAHSISNYEAFSFYCLLQFCYIKSSEIDLVPRTRPNLLAEDS